MLPVRTTAPYRGRAIVVWTIVALCAAVFLLQAALPPAEEFALVVDHALIPLRYSDARWALAVGLDPRDYGPFLTMAFLHGGWLHLIFNMWTLWLFGRAVETRLGRLRFAVLYLACALLASWAQATVYPESNVPVIGASGAVAGVLGAHVMLFHRARVVILLLIVIFPVWFGVSALWYVGFWFLTQLYYGTGSLAGEAIGGVAWWAHIGGFLAGLAFVRLLAPPPPPGDAAPAAD
ncbi:MAG: rhomboid family intramembrane serine protease [Inquilinus sp.]|nr:rhomboid family intramembrane serine protease [Inquilinus sp.]